MGVKLKSASTFFDKIEKTETCWLWTGAIVSGGYGNFNLYGKFWPAHRLMWVISNGDIPLDKCVLHKCDIRKCVNPDHLFIGTRKDNADDMVKKGRQRGHKWDKNGRAKLTRSQVKELRVNVTKYNQRNLADDHAAYPF